MNEVTRGRWAQAICNDDFICVETYSGYRGGDRRDQKGKQNFVVPTAPDEDLGAAVLDALAHSRWVLPVRKNDSTYPAGVEFDMEHFDFKLNIERHAAWTKALMDRYGYKTKRALFNGMNNLSIESKDGVIVILPSHHEKLEAWSGDGISASDQVVIPANSPPRRDWRSTALGV